MTPHTFLDLLWRYKPEDQYILLWTLQDKRSHWFQDVGTAAEFAEAAASRHDVYVGLGLSKADHGPARRCKSEEVSGICGVGGDFDLKSAAHGIKPLPSTVPDALSVIPAILPPTIVLATGNGAHAWWLFREPLIFETDQDRTDAARTLTRWHTMLRLGSAAKGWAYDRLSDLARILRIAGTRNYKDPANPKDVVVHSRTDRFYNLSDIEEFLNDAAIPDPEEEERAAREWKERFADSPLVINPNARIAEDMLNRWMDGDAIGDQKLAMKFRNTWNRQRHDLRDQTGSGYDLALADFGVDAGLSEQQIVDLIVHHRVLHKQRQRTKLDYYQRTIAKAQRRSEYRDGPAAPSSQAIGTGEPAPAPTTGPVAPQGAPDAPQAEEAPSDTTPAPPPDPEAESRRKALLCVELSRVLTISVMRLVKITGKESQYRMELADGQKIEFPNVNKFLSQECVSSAIADKAGKIIPKIKPKEWHALKQKMLDACIIVEGTEEMEWEGAARIYLQQYLSQTGFIPCIDGQRLQDQRKPMVMDGAITVCTSAVQIYVNKTTFQNLSVKAIAGMLSALGARSIRVRGPKFKDQSRWALPFPEFDPAEYPQAGGADVTVQ